MSDSQRPCPSPHPVRSAGGGPADELEVVGSHASACWTRCNRCGRWFWLETDQSRFQYWEERELDRALASRALTGGDPAAVVELLITHGLPHGPLWELPEARVELLVALTPSASNADRIAALRRHSLDATWTAALRQQEALTQCATRTVAPDHELPFAVALAHDFSTFSGPFECDGAVFLLRAGPPATIWQITPERVVEIPIAGPPRLAALAPERMVVHVTADDREGLLFLDATTMVPIELVAARGHLLVESLDGGAWMLHHVDDSLVELRDRDLKRLASYRFAKNHPEHFACRPRRLDDGWLVSSVIDSAGQASALACLDADFHVVARSEERGLRDSLTVLGDGFFTAHTNEDRGTLELWQQQGDRLVRHRALPSRASLHIDDHLVVLDHDRTLACFDRGGDQLWSRQVVGPGALLHRVGERVIVYRDHRAVLVDPADGALEQIDEPFALSFARDCDQNGYLVAGPTVLRIRGRAMERTDLEAPYRFATTAADAIILADPRAPGRYLVLGADGVRRGVFEAPRASLSVVATRGGPYLLEPDRLRIAGFAQSR
ncbi:hypothetical protein [Haliangium sp.]|uniref:hypothetical protein n=1 Tax=Haliangium sp. TaxID=2663208 RepID=UPI003D0CDE93